MSLYVYALGDRPAEGGQGLAGEPLRWVPCGSFYAAVGELAEAPAVEPPAIRGHDAAVKRLAESVRALLPARFGSMVRDEAALQELLQPRSGELAQALELVADREQMTLRLFGPSDLPEPQVAPAPEFEHLGPGARYLAQRQAALRARQLAPELDAVRPQLAAWIQAERVERHKGGALRASVFHLIPRNASAAYREALEQAVGAAAPFKIVVSGPWPAYAFAPEALA